MRKQKNEKGITLIALVVTIIVLLILAGVTIVTLTGENGILSQANTAGEDSKKAEIIEKAQMDIFAVQAENEGKLTKGQFVGILDTYFVGVPTEENLPEDLTTLTLTTKAEYGTLQINIAEIYNGTFSDASVAEEKTVEDLQLGDRVYYKDKNNIERECYVLYDASSPYGVQIITKDVVAVDEVKLGPSDPTITIGATDGINDPIDADSTNLEKARVSYNNALRTLYNKAQEYLNTSYASSARCVGSKPDDPDWDARVDEDGNPINEAALFTSSYNYMSAYNNTLKVGENVKDITDWIQMEAIGNTTDVDIKASNDGYWWASRDASSDSDSSNFGVRSVSAAGSLGYPRLVQYLF